MVDEQKAKLETKDQKQIMKKQTKTNNFYGKQIPSPNN
jgi:hypothetical protein